MANWSEGPPTCERVRSLVRGSSTFLTQASLPRVCCPPLVSASLRARLRLSSLAGAAGALFCPLDRLPLKLKNMFNQLPSDDLRYLLGVMLIDLRLPGRFEALTNELALTEFVLALVSGELVRCPGGAARFPGAVLRIQCFVELCVSRQSEGGDARKLVHSAICNRFAPVTRFLGLELFSSVPRERDRLSVSFKALSSLLESPGFDARPRSVQAALRLLPHLYRAAGLRRPGGSVSCRN